MHEDDEITLSVAPQFFQCFTAGNIENLGTGPGNKAMFVYNLNSLKLLSSLKQQPSIEYDNSTVEWIQIFYSTHMQEVK